MNMKSKLKNIKKLVKGESKAPAEKKYTHHEMRISIKKDGDFIGYKADTFWSVCKYDGKRHKAIEENLINNLLYILNSDEGFIKHYPYDGANKLTLELVNDEGKVKETVEIIKNNQEKYEQRT